MSGGSGAINMQPKNEPTPSPRPLIGARIIDLSLWSWANGRRYARRPRRWVIKVEPSAGAMAFATWVPVEGCERDILADQSQQEVARFESKAS